METETIDQKIIQSGKIIDFETFADFFSTKFIRKNEGVNALWDFIKKHPDKRVPQFSKALKVPSKTIERWLKVLKNEEKIEFRGSPKVGGYLGQTKLT